MQSEPTITFRNLDSSPAVERHVKERIVDLEKYHPGIISCDVVIEMPQKPKVSGRAFEVHIKVAVPGSDVHASHMVQHSEGAENLDLAINEAFARARRMLQDQDREMDVFRAKHHPQVEHGEIDRIFEGEGYGFIKTPGGVEYYFSRESLNHDFWDELHVGSKMRFRGEDGENGLFASNVTLID